MPEMDPQVAIQLITAGCVNTHPCSPMVKDIQSSKQKEVTSIGLMCLEKLIKLRDGMAKYGLSLQGGSEIFQCCPQFISNVFADASAVTFPRGFQFLFVLGAPPIQKENELQMLLTGFHG